MAIDIDSYIDKLTARAMRDDTQKALDYTKISIVLSIPQQFAADMAAQGNDMASKLNSLKPAITEARKALSDVSKSYADGSAESYEVSEAEAELAMLLRQRSNAMAIIANADAFSVSVGTKSLELLAAVR